MAETKVTLLAETIFHTAIELDQSVDTVEVVGDPVDIEEARYLARERLAKIGGFKIEPRVESDASILRKLKGDYDALPDPKPEWSIIEKGITKSIDSIREIKDPVLFYDTGRGGFCAVMEREDPLEGHQMPAMVSISLK